MPGLVSMQTQRLELSAWRESDWLSLKPVAADPEVMRYISDGHVWSPTPIISPRAMSWKNSARATSLTRVRRTRYRGEARLGHARPLHSILRWSLHPVDNKCSD